MDRRVPQPSSLQTRPGFALGVEPSALVKRWPLTLDPSMQGPTSRLVAAFRIYN
jgi:hypothetical protein